MYRELEKNIKKNPQIDVLQYAGKNIKNQELLGHICNFAARLSEIGVRAGDVITIALPNIPEFVIAFYAINKIGGICNLISSKLSAEEVLIRMGKSKSRFAILVDEAYCKEKELFDSVENQYIFADLATFMPAVKGKLYRMKNGVKAQNLKGVSFYSENEKGEKETEIKEVATYNFQKHELAVYIQSRGEVQSQKTVLLSNENINFAVKIGSEIFDHVPDYGATTIAALEMSTGFGLCYAMHLPLLQNILSVLSDGYNEKETVPTLKKIKASVLCASPEMFEKLLSFKGFVAKDILHNLEVAFCGGGVASLELYQKFNAIMGMGGSKCRLFQGFGMPETVTAVTSCTDKNDKKHSCGKPLAGVRIKILDSKGKELPRCEKGQIIVSAPSVMIGYAVKETIVKNGYLHTGLYGYVDDEGYLFADSVENIK